jgi:hypothetical protein
MSGTVPQQGYSPSDIVRIGVARLSNSSVKVLEVFSSWDILNSE